MQHLSRVFLVSSLVLGSLALGASPASAAKKKWPGKKHHTTQHSSSKPASTKSTGAAKKADDDDDNDSGGEAAEADEKPEETTKKSKKAQATNDGAGSEEDEGESSKRASRGDGDEEDDGESTVVRRKPKRVAMDDAGAPVAFELEAGARVIHRSFDFNDPLSNYNPSAAKPYAYVLPRAPAPFLDLALYPAAFATRSFAANIGLVAQYERLVGTSTEAPNGSSFDTVAQQLQIGARVRLPVADHEIGLTAAYGKQTFQITANDPGPGAGSVPNVDYTFAKVGADVRLRFAEAFELGAHVGTRLVLDTGSLGTQWFHKVKTSSVEAGASLAYRLTPMFQVVGGAELIRYGFDFNPVPTSAAFVAGGAVDQYLSGYLALRVSFAGG